jgi:hypothetical protein
MTRMAYTSKTKPYCKERERGREGGREGGRDRVSRDFKVPIWRELKKGRKRESERRKSTRAEQKTYHVVELVRPEGGEQEVHLDEDGAKG